MCEIVAWSRCFWWVIQQDLCFAILMNVEMEMGCLLPQGAAPWDFPASALFLLRSIFGHEKWSSFLMNSEDTTTFTEEWGLLLQVIGLGTSLDLCNYLKYTFSHTSIQEFKNCKHSVLSFIYGKDF